MPAVRSIEIIGGGLAGLSLGLALRREGVPVTLLEAGDYPRHRVCGEFIAGLSRTTERRLGLAGHLAAAPRHRELAWYVGPERVRVQRLPEAAIGVSRHLLDAALARDFEAAGGDLRRRTRATDVAPKPGRVFATGRRPGRATWLGLKIHVRGMDLSNSLEMHLGNFAYVGLAGIEGGSINVCGLFRRLPLRAKGVDLLARYMRATGLEALAGRLVRAETDPESFCAVASIGFDGRVPLRDHPSVGDACAVAPPFTGNGMAMAFQSAESALDPLLAYARGLANWGETGRRIQLSLRRRFRFRLASAGLLHPWMYRPLLQRWFAAAGRARLAPLGQFYALTH